MSQKNTKTRVAIGMSGGVDSSLAAALLVEAGYDVTGVHLECWSEPGCRAPEDRKDALAVSVQLGIPFEVLDYQKQYKKKVIEYFYREYRAGRTPNPDVMCNLKIKFGLFYNWALKKGFDYVATGHYARVGLKSLGLNKEGIRGKVEEKIKVIPLDIDFRRDDRRLKNQGIVSNKAKEFVLLRSVDEKKDQTYFLYRLRQEKLRKLIFPIGDLTKSEVRKQARKRDLAVADKPDSVGICFVGEVKVQEFLRRKIKEKQGEVVDLKGNVVGEHKGVWFYTIGQRHGFRVNTKSIKDSFKNKFKTGIPPLYVLGKDVVQNRLVVGFEKDAYTKEFTVGSIHWINAYNNSSKAKKVLVRIRHGGKMIPAKLEKIGGKRAYKCILSEAEKGVAPGQSAVFYLPAGKAGKSKECLGGGIIQ